MILHFRDLHQMGLVAPIIVTMLASCSRDVPTSALIFPETSVDLGLIDGSQNVVHEFPFEVAERMGVKIDNVLSTCKCTAVSSAEIGQQLAFRDRGSIRVVVDPQERSGKMLGTVIVETIPPSALPIVLNLTAMVAARPQVVGQSPIRVSAVLGSSVHVDFDVATERPQQAQPLIIDAARSDFGDFRIEREVLIESKVSPIGAQTEETVHEIHRFRLNRDPLTALGSHQETLKIAWQKQAELTQIPLSIDVSHPLEVRPANPFVGFVRPKEKKKVRLDFTTPNPQLINSLQIEPASDSNADQAFYDAESNQVQVEVTAPENPGRFGTTWILRCTDPAVPPFRFTVSGLVEEGATDDGDTES